MKRKVTGRLLSALLATAMWFGLVSQISFSQKAAAATESMPVSVMEGLRIAYPYNTDLFKQDETVVSRFEALTFYSARQETESAQMILTPDFDVSSFKLTMSDLFNEKGNVLPAYSFEVYTQHYVSVSGSKNAPNYSSQYDIYHPEMGMSNWNGTYPDALIPQAAAIDAGENTITAGKNQGIWVNLNVGEAAPGTYTGYATLAVNNNKMQIPVSVRIFDVEVPEEVHVKSSFAIWWDMLEKGEGYVNRELADAYFDYLVSKRLSPYDAWAITKFDDALTKAAEKWAADPKISAYGLRYSWDENRVLDEDALKTTLRSLINKNISLAESGSDIDLFKKAYFYFGTICDEPRNDQEYAEINIITQKLTAALNELSPLLASYPALQESFLNIKHVVTGPNPADKTFADKHANHFNLDIDYGNTVATGENYLYVPQYMWLHTEEQRALYAAEEELWWYGCMHPVAPYPTYHVNTPIISARAVTWMMYDYDVDGMLHGCVNFWGDYTNNGIDLLDFWNQYSGRSAPGDQILLYPGSDYGVFGPIGTIRLETIRESLEDYEYLWLLEQFTGSKAAASTYLTNLYEGVIPNTDTSVHHNNRLALLAKLEEFNIAENGATDIKPGEENFIRGELVAAATDKTFMLDNAAPAVCLQFDYKITDGSSFHVALLNSWSSYYGYYGFTADGCTADGITTTKLSDGYIRVMMHLNALTKIIQSPGNVINMFYIRGNWSNAAVYIDNIVALPDYPMSSNLPLYVEEGSHNYISFDYQMDNLGQFEIAVVSPDKRDYYGYYTFDSNGGVETYPGVYCEDLGDGVCRVLMATSELTRTNDAGNVSNAPSRIGILHIRNCTAEGVISNVQVSNVCIHSYKTAVVEPSFTADGYFHRVCSHCGDSDMSDKIPAYTFSVEKWSVTLKDNISAVFHINIDSPKKQTAVRMRVAGTTVNYPLENLQTQDDRYVVTVDIAAAQMTEDIVIQAVCGTAESEAVHYSVRQYANSVLSGQYPEATKSLVKSMLNYGAAAQEYFAYRIDDLANAGYEITTPVSIPEVDASNMVSGSVQGIKFYGASAVFRSKVAVRFYFAVDGNINDYTFSAGNAPVAKDGLYYVEIPGIHPQDYDKPIPLLVSSDTEQMTVTYSPLYYISRMHSSSGNVKLHKLMEEMYRYHQQSLVYLESLNHGQAFKSGKDLTIRVDCPNNVETLSFEYKVTGGTHFYIAALDHSWSKYYGYFMFDTNGVSEQYRGIACEKLEDGYYRVTLTLSELNRTNNSFDRNNAPAQIGLIYILGRINEADGYIDNISWTLRDYDQQYEGGNFVSNTDLTIPLTPDAPVTRLTFDYQITSGSVFTLAAVNSSWGKYYGHYEFDKDGAAHDYNGISWEALENGYVRVTMVLSELNRTNNNYDRNNVPEQLAILYISGRFTNANGKITNIRLYTT